MAGIWQLARWPGREHWGVAKKNHFQRPRRGPKWATNKVSALLPVKVGVFDLGKLSRYRDQLWAEATVREAPIAFD